MLILALEDLAVAARDRRRHDCDVRRGAARHGPRLPGGAARGQAAPGASWRAPATCTGSSRGCSDGGLAPGLAPPGAGRLLGAVRAAGLRGGARYVGVRPRRRRAGARGPRRTTRWCSRTGGSRAPATSTASRSRSRWTILAIAASEVGAITERRIDRMLDPTRSQGLPPFLSARAGTNSGFMIPHYTAASLAEENRRLAVPASVGSLPASGMQEDHNSLGWSAGRKLRGCSKTSPAYSRSSRSARPRPSSFAPRCDRVPPRPRCCGASGARCLSCRGSVPRAGPGCPRAVRRSLGAKRRRLECGGSDLPLRSSGGRPSGPRGPRRIARRGLGSRVGYTAGTPGEGRWREIRRGTRRSRARTSKGSWTGGTTPSWSTCWRRCTTATRTCRARSTSPWTRSGDRAPDLLPDKDAEIVVYCMDPPCEASEEAAIRTGHDGIRERVGLRRGQEGLDRGRSPGRGQVLRASKGEEAMTERTARIPEGFEDLLEITTVAHVATIGPERRAAEQPGVVRLGRGVRQVQPDKDASEAAQPGARPQHLLLDRRPRQPPQVPGGQGRRRARRGGSRPRVHKRDVQEVHRQVPSTRTTVPATSGSWSSCGRSTPRRRTASGLGAARRRSDRAVPRRGRRASPAVSPPSAARSFTCVRTSGRPAWRSRRCCWPRRRAWRRRS